MTVEAGTRVRVVGIVLSQQRPGTAGGVCLITLEDESGLTNLVVFEKLFEQFRQPVLYARLMMVEGYLQREEMVLQVIAYSIHDLTPVVSESIRLSGCKDLREEQPFAVHRTEQAHAGAGRCCRR